MRKRKVDALIILFLFVGGLLVLLRALSPIRGNAAEADPVFLPLICQSPPNLFPANSWIQNYWINQTNIPAYFNGMELTNDEDIMLTGYVQTGFGNDNGTLAKVTQDGNLVWLKQITGTRATRFSKIAIAQDGGYWVAGRINTGEPYLYYPWLVRFNSAGNILWQKMFSSFGVATFADIYSTSDGGLLAVIQDQVMRANIVKLDSNGNISWAREISPTGNLMSAIESPDGAYILAGTSYKLIQYPDYQELDGLWVAKLNTDGSTMWQKYYSQVQNVRQLIQKPFGIVARDGGYTVGVHVLMYPAKHSLWVLHLDSTGGVAWQKSFANTGNQYSDMTVTQDNGVVLVGANSYFPWILKLTNSGSIAWQRVYLNTSPPNTPSVAGISEMNTGELILAGNGKYYAENPGLLLMRMSNQGVVESCYSLGDSEITRSQPQMVTESATNFAGSRPLTVENTYYSTMDLTMGSAFVCPEIPDLACSSHYYP